MTATGYYMTTSTSGTSATWSSNNVVYSPVTGQYAIDPGSTVKAAPPKPKSNLTRLHDRVEATCARARLAA